MKYYCIADPHGYFDIFKDTLQNAGYFQEMQPHKLVILGDLFDRGGQEPALQNFVMERLHRDELILIRGNHEDLFMRFATVDSALPMTHHIRNGTYDTALLLTGFDWETARIRNEDLAKACRETAFFREIIPAMVDFYETPHYVFVHGWIPAQKLYGHLAPVPDWRKAGKEMWERARWLNGMAAYPTVYERGKTIVCGHWHTSYGHALESGGGEFGPYADFSPFYGDGILALDACTAVSGRMHCIVLED